MKEENYNIIKNPSLLNDENLQNIHSLLNDFPYFFPPYFLLLHHYKNTQNPEFQNFLYKYIWYIPDKQILIQYLNNLFSPFTEEKEKNEIKKEKKEHNSSTYPLRKENNNLSETIAEVLKEANNTTVSEDFEKKIIPSI